MALQESVAVRNAGLDAKETAIGTSAVLKIRTGAPPADCATADSGTVLVTCSLPSDWMAAASGGSKAKAGTWSDAGADASGLAGHFRLYSSDGTTCGMQGNCAETWVGSKAYILNQQVNNDTGKCYKCITAGTSASSGGPTGTGSDITDGTAHWQYVGTTELVLDNGNIVASQPFTQNSFTLTAANA